VNVETQQHLTTLRDLLTYRVHELEAEIHAAAMERAREAADVDRNSVIDQKDEAETEQRGELIAQEERLTNAALSECRAALQRLDEGVFGDCRDCGEPIPLARLMVQPQAERCAPCQAVFERVHRAMA
jgi:RNA polymerase-binding transcription factor DksA